MGICINKGRAGLLLLLLLLIGCRHRGDVVPALPVENAAYYWRTTWSLDSTETAFLQEHGIDHPQILMEARDMETNFLTCAQGLGVTFSYHMYFRHFTGNRKCRYPLYAIPINPPNGAPSTVMLRSLDHYCSNAAKHFMEICRNVTDFV